MSKEETRTTESTGVFISVEGPDGAGKTSMLNELLPRLEVDMIRELVTTREPGGIKIAEKIRQLILDPQHTDMDERTEALLYAAARRQHVVQKIRPALERGAVVICDRYVDSSLAYQGAGRGIGIEEIASINHFAIEDTMPTLTLYLDVDAETGLERIYKGRCTTELDRLDVETPVFHQRVRHAYLELIEKEPQRFVLIDAKENIEVVVEKCYDIIKEKYSHLFS